MHSEDHGEKHRLPPGCSLTLMLPAGHELYCLQGCLRIVPDAQMLGDSLHVPARVLPLGQAWRAGHPQRITIRNDGEAPCMVAQVRPQAALSAAPKTNSLAAWAARLFEETVRWLRRAPSAASMKSP